MGRQLSTREWIKNADQIWGGVYDYSKVKYINSKTHVTVVCRIHGPWSCRPTNHTKKSKPRGCPKCGREKQIEKATKSYDSFLTDARAIHGNTYRYDRSTYKGAKTTIVITCPKHGEFRQSPDAHINQKVGCPTCGHIKHGLSHRVDEDLINTELSERSNGLVSLVPSGYSGKNHKARFVCKKHGEFSRMAGSALIGDHPCLLCSGGTRYSSGYSDEDIARKIRERFGARYDIKPIRYQNQESRITLVCSKHGDFSLRFSTMRRSPGCPRCAYDSSQQKRKTSHRKAMLDTLANRYLDWLTHVQGVHGDKYDYSKVEYKSQGQKVLIVCPDHGDFAQTPYKHMKSGCNQCANEDLKGRYTDKYFEDFPERKSRPAFLYYVRFSYKHGHFYKVGVTSTSVEERFILIKKARIQMEVLNILDTTLYEAFRIEQRLQREYGDRARYRPKLSDKLVRDIRIGPSECFSTPLPRLIVRDVFGDA